MKEYDPIRIAYKNMKARCYRPSCPDYRKYGARGITMCERWLNSYVAFVEDMGPRPSPKHSIDRIDRNGNYEPGNCRWATPHEQAQNTARNVVYEHDGESMCLSAWARKLGISESTLWGRLNTQGLSFAEAIFKPLHRRKRRVNGDEVSV